MTEEEKEERLQDSIPDEVRLKYVFAECNDAKKRLEEALRYSKGLEEENVALQKQLEKHFAWMKEHPEEEDLMTSLKNKVSQMRGYIFKVYPKRVMEMKYLRNKIAQLDGYIKELQSLLKENNIPYGEMKPLEDNPYEEITPKDINIYAVRGNELMRIKGIDD